MTGGRAPPPIFMAIGKIKTEHGGAKNGGGYWGGRADAKAYSKKKRRQNGKKAIKEQLKDKS